MASGLNTALRKTFFIEQPVLGFSLEIWKPRIDQGIYPRIKGYILE